jgi:hypothetical protein
MRMDAKKLLLASTAVLVALVAAPTALPRGAIAALIGNDVGSFHADCGASHRASDDPIVFPGQPGASHSHDFVGATTTDASATNASIRRGATTCSRDDEAVKWQPDGKLRAKNPHADRSGYWVPTLYDDGTPLQPTMGAYYTAGRRGFRAIKPFPDDLRVIAGSAKGGPIGGEPKIVDWRCAPGQTLDPGSKNPPVAPTCKTERLDLDIRFPDCWNGRDSDSPDHKSHMAYSRKAKGGAGYVCPPDHPVLVPALRLGLRYPTTGGSGVRLSSGAINTAHADFMNGWAPDKLAKLVRACLNIDKYCGGGSVPDRSRRTHPRSCSGRHPAGRRRPGHIHARSSREAGQAARRCRHRHRATRQQPPRPRGRTGTRRPRA